MGNGAQERTRTFTTLRSLAPEASASTNSATWALRCSYVGKVSFVNACHAKFARTPALRRDNRATQWQSWGMQEVFHISLGRQARQLRLDTLVRLRWLAIIGQLGAVAGTYFGLHFAVPIILCLIVILLSVVANIGLRLLFPQNTRLSDFAAFSLLSYDVVQLSLLLYLTGGLQNPFAMLFLAPIMISASSLPKRFTFGLVGLMMFCASILALWHQPLPWFDAEAVELPFLYIGGIWVAIVLGAAFISIYASRVAEEARQLADALAATELVLAREQHLTQLDGLAAAAAHELGSPLATITLVIKELGNLVPKGNAIAEDIELLRQEAMRCKMILSKLTSLGQEGAGLLEEITLEHLLEDVVAPQRDFGVKVKITTFGDQPMPICRKNAGVTYGLGNLIENAIDFANSSVAVVAFWNAQSVTVQIKDDGPGFSPDVLNRVGEPYISTRNPDRRAKNSEGDGLGLGLFIAKSLLERSGAHVAVSNRAAPNSGAQVEIIWPRAMFDITEKPTRRDQTSNKHLLATAPASDLW